MRFIVAPFRRAASQSALHHGYRFEMTFKRLACFGSSFVLLAVVGVGCDSESSSNGTNNPSTPGGGDAGVASTCPPLTGPGTKHSTAITSDETWTAAASPHVVTFPQSIAAGSTLTLEPCAVVKLDSRIGFLVEGKLVASGAADKPIRFERNGAEAWSSIETREGSELRLAYTTLEGGGNANGGRLTQFGAIDLRGDQDVTPQPIFLADHVTIKDSASLGIWAREGGAFAPGSTDLTITGGASFPMLVWSNASGTVPSGSYTGNAIDEIFLPALENRDQIKVDTTLANRGVPYRIGGDTAGTSLTVGGDATPVLTIEPGVTLRFAKQTRLFVANNGANATGGLKAEGTADAPITFTSAEDAPMSGDWGGIQLSGTPDPRTSIAHAKIAYAGGTTGISSYGCPSPPSGTFVNRAGIVIFDGAPTRSFVTNTAIEDSAGDGIVRGWTGDKIDFTASNTFTNIAWCNQSEPKPNMGMCSAECPN
jgi:hypothetical protein